MKDIQGYEVYSKWLLHKTMKMYDSIISSLEALYLGHMRLWQV